jgi:hypothetical protein
LILIRFLIITTFTFKGRLGFIITTRKLFPMPPLEVY